MKKLMLALFLCQSIMAQAATPGPWEMLSTGDEDGIKVWKRVHKGSTLLEFRGQGKIDGSIAQVMTLLTDPNRILEWVEGSVKADLLEKNYSLDDESLFAESKIENLHHIQHMEHFVPFPFENRDVVIEGTVSYYHDKKNDHKGAFIKSRSVSRDSVPPIQGVTRMPFLSNVTDVRMIDATHTLVDFKVRADPGGMIPEWIVNLSSSRIPHITISNIRDMVKKGVYDKKRLRLVNFHIEKARQQIKDSH